MIEEGKVVRKEGSRVFIKPVNTSACKKCGLCPSRSGGLIEEESAILQVGDEVEIESSDTDLVRYSLLVYLVPSFAFVAGLVLGLKLIKAEWGSIAGGVIFLFLSLVFLRRRLRSVKPKIGVRKKPKGNA